MRRRLIIVISGLVILGLVSFLPLPLHIDNDGNGYDSAKVLRVRHHDGQADQLDLIIASGPRKGMTVSATVGALTTSVDIRPPQYATGDSVIVNHGVNPLGQDSYTIIDRYRLPLAIWFFGFIIVLAITFAGWRGIGSLVGLLISLLIVARFIIPMIIAGHNAYLVTAVGIVIISLLGIFLAHGFSKRTSIALLGTYITLFLTVGFSWLVVSGLHLTGIANENTFYLGHKLPQLSMPGVLLCGMILCLVGILDDMTVGQATAVEELHKANPKLSRRELYRRGLLIGREHIASLINTLVLAFVGTSFIFIFYIAATTPYPLIVNLNSEQVMEEVARSIIGSCALILAVPITTLLAARYLGNPDKPTEIPND